MFYSIVTISTALTKKFLFFANVNDFLRTYSQKNNEMNSQEFPRIILVFVTVAKKNNNVVRVSFVKGNTKFPFSQRVFITLQI